MRVRVAISCGMWLGLAALAPPADSPTLPYLLDGVGSDASGDRSPSPEPESERVPSGASELQSAGGARWTLTVDAGITADSNITNSGDLHALPPGSGDLSPDSPYRERQGVGLGLSASAALRLPVGGGVALAVDAEGYRLDYDGVSADDSAILLAAGTELAAADGGRGALQMVAFERWYGGISANRGLGLRARWRQPVGRQEHVAFSVDARRVESGYGDDFGGWQGSAYLTYEGVLGPDLSAALGLFARREWLETDSYSNLEFGLYGGISHYLSDDLLGSLSVGASRLTFDGPVLFLAPEAREDWRYFLNASLTTRKPVLLGIHPSLTYSYNRTDSSTPFYRADRHRLRLGLLRAF